MQNKNEVILAMCKEYRPDYDVRKEDTDPPWLAGLTATDAKMLYIVMEKIYDQFIEPLKPFYKKSSKKRRKHR
jgi:hypothetical protein